MKINRAKKIIAFYEELSLAEKSFLGSIVFSERTQNAVESITKKEKPIRKGRKRRDYNGFQRNSDEQVRYAWELMQKGEDYREISKKTGINKGSISKAYIKGRIDKMQKKIPKDDKIATW